MHFFDLQLTLVGLRNHRLIMRFARTNAALLFTLTCLAGVNAGTVFMALSSINRAPNTNATFPAAAQAAMLIALLVVSATLTQRLSSKLGTDFVSELRIIFARRLLTHAYSPGSSQRSRGLSAFINDIAEVSPLSLMAPLVFYNLIFALVAAIYLFSLSPLLTSILLLELIVLFSLSIIMRRPIVPSFEKLRKVDDDLFSNIQIIEDARKELLINRRRANHFVNAVVIPSINSARGTLYKAHLSVGYYEAWSSSIVYIIIIVTLFIGSTVVPLPRDNLASFIVGCLIMISPLNALMSSSQQLSRGVAALQRLSRFNEEVHLKQLQPAITPGVNWETLVLQDVSYSYKTSSELGSLIGPINITISRGEIIFIVGQNGSGKTTLLLLLCGLLKPSNGNIFLDQNHLDDVGLSYRELLSAVFCDFHLFKHVLDKSGNLAPEEDIDSLLSTLGLSSVIKVEGSELLTTDVSAGQRKRLALLQLLLEDRDVLILDEMAADLDPEFKSYFYDTILEDLRRCGKTIILTTHDDKFFSCADRLLRLEGGHIVEDSGKTTGLGV